MNIIAIDFRHYKSGQNHSQRYSECNNNDSGYRIGINVRIEFLQPLYVSQSQKSPAQIFLIPVERHPLIQTYKNIAQLFPLAIET